MAEKRQLNLTELPLSILFSTILRHSGEREWEYKRTDGRTKQLNEGGKPIQEPKREGGSE